MLQLSLRNGAAYCGDQAAVEGAMPQGIVLRYTVNAGKKSAYRWLMPGGRTANRGGKRSGAPCLRTDGDFLYAAV